MPSIFGSIVDSIRHRNILTAQHIPCRPGPVVHLAIRDYIREAIVADTSLIHSQKRVIRFPECFDPGSLSCILGANWDTRRICGS